MARNGGKLSLQDKDVEGQHAGCDGPHSCGKDGA